MTAYQKDNVQERTVEEYEAAHTNYFGCQQEDDDTLEKALHEHFQKA